MADESLIPAKQKQNPVLRKYQENILEVAKEKNTLVVLPTGLGKTLIAFELIDYRLKYGKPNAKALFLAPTKPLVDQHFTNFKRAYGWEAHMLTGAINSSKRKEIWEKAKVIFATPQTIANDLESGLISLENVSVIVFDEAHRCLKHYDYVNIAKAAKAIDGIRILGLTASPSEEKSKIDEICRHLNIDAIEIRTRESEDVKPYIKKLRVKVIKVSLDKELLEVRELLDGYYKKKLEELSNRGFLFKKNITKKEIITLQKMLQMQASQNKGDYNLLRALTAIAIALKLQHALELLETQSINALYLYLQDLYEQAEAKKSKAVREIINNKDFKKAFVKVVELYNKGKENPKLEKLKEVIEEEKRANPNFKAIIFTQFRDNVARISEYLSKMGLSNRCFIGQAKRREDGLTQKEQKKIIEEFKNNNIGLLVSTSIGEEGLDIPEVDAVIFYEPVPSAIRKIQRAGRTARTKEGKVIILMAESTRDEAYYWAAWHKEKRMYKIIESINQKLKQSKSGEFDIPLDKFIEDDEKNDA
jgi:ERCC4-related helicase